MISTSETNITTSPKYSEILLKNNFGTSTSDTVFKKFVELEDTKNQSVVDDSIMYYSTVSIANKIAEEDDIQSECGGNRVLVNKMIDEQVFNYRIAIISQVKGLLQFSSKTKVKDEIGGHQGTIFIIDASTPHLPHPRFYERDYTRNLSALEYENGKPASFKLEDNGYHIFDKTSDQINFEEMDSDDLIAALARYYLYRRNVISELTWSSFDRYIDAYTFIFKKNLQERFNQCACCTESVRNERDDEIVFTFESEVYKKS
jgi:hypothetical protein